MARRVISERESTANVLYRQTFPRDSFRPNSKYYPTATKTSVRIDLRALFLSSANEIIGNAISHMHTKRRESVCINVGRWRELESWVRVKNRKSICVDGV